MTDIVANSNRSRASFRPERVTIQDVANAAGVTKGTVSRALNGYTDISANTRSRIKRVAKQLRYRPLSYAQAIRTGYAKAVGFVLQTNEPDAHRPFLAGFLAGMSRATTDAGWTLTVATAESDEDLLTTIDRLVEERKADGFILPRTHTQDKRIDFLKSRNIPFVLFGRTANSDGCAWFDICSEHSIARAVTILEASGHRRIAFVNGGSQYHYSRIRRQGYLTGLRNAGIGHDPELEARDAISRRAGSHAARTMLTLDSPPTAFVFSVDRAALGLYQVAQEYDLTIGKDLSVISYDGIPDGALCSPPLSTFSVDRPAAGEALVRLLIARIRGKDPAELRKLGHASFLPRGSHGKPGMTSPELRTRLDSILHDPSTRE